LFKVKGWKAISEVHASIISDISYWRNLSENDDFFNIALPEANKECWKLIDDIQKHGIITPSGSVLEISWPFLSKTFDESQQWGYYVHLNTGTLGSGNLLSEDPKKGSPEDWVRSSFGPFSYCPVVLGERECSSKLLAISNRERKNSSQPHSELFESDDLVRSILEIHLNGEWILKSEYKRILAPSMKYEAFNAAWREAASIRPDISRSGPKPKSQDVE
jgi:hypothetical protein